MSLNSKNILFYVALLGLVAWACINPIKDFVQIDVISFTTIEADIADDSELSKVRLTSSSDRLISQFSLPISDASVSVTDQNGSQFTFTEGIPTGTYYPTAGFKGLVGSSYKLSVKLLTGQMYESTVETMKAIPEIENVITRFEILDQYAKEDVRRAGFTVYLDFKDMPTEGDFYLWNWRHYEKIGFCATCIEGGSYDYDKLGCVQSRFPSKTIFNYMCDGNCWDITTNNEINVFSDVLTNGQRVVGRQVARIPFDNFTPYYFRLEQRSITRNAFNFYQSLIAQIQASGSLFDVPAQTRFGLNIKSTSNPEEKVIGIFNVFSVKKKIFIINRKDNIPAGEEPIRRIMEGETYTCPPGSVGCRDKVPCFESNTRTKKIPEGWVF
jgi:hypothetical protein